MESTVVFWKPVYNLLEALDFNLLVVNAMKPVPGRKWLSRLGEPLRPGADFLGRQRALPPVAGAVPAIASNFRRAAGVSSAKANPSLAIHLLKRATSNSLMRTVVCGWPWHARSSAMLAARSQSGPSIPLAGGFLIRI